MKPKKPTRPVLIPNPSCLDCDGSGRRLVQKLVHGRWYDFNGPCGCLKPVADLPVLRRDYKSSASGPEAA